MPLSTPRRGSHIDEANELQPYDLALSLSACVESDESEALDEEELGTVEQPLLAAPVPQADATVIGTTGVWKSKRDNPRVTGTQTLLSWESVQVGGTLSPYGLNFELFNLTARTVRSNGGSTVSLWAFPSSNAAPSQPMVWVTRGTKLPRRMGTVTQDQLEIDAIYDHKSVMQGPFPWTNKAKVVLDPDVHLLPIQVVQLYSVPAGYPSNVGATENMAKVVFDDAALTDQYINTTPTTNPDSVLHTWQKDGRDEDLPILRPDDVWLQCGIQFQLIHYASCEVPREVMIPQEDICTDNALTQQANAAINAADDCEAAQRGDGLRIIYTGKLVDPDCPTQVGGLTALGGNTAVVSPSALNWGSRTVTHEVGHLLNLVDLTGSNQDRLMFNNSTASTGNLLTAAECSTARGAALAKQSEWP